MTQQSPIEASVALQARDPLDVICQVPPEIPSVAAALRPKTSIEIVWELGHEG